MRDENFEGSIFEKMGFDAELCPKCNAHLHGGICLNACHLSESQMKRFQLIMEQISREREVEKNE